MFYVVRSMDYLLTYLHIFKNDAIEEQTAETQQLNSITVNV